METDLVLKRLFKSRGQDLVWLTGDRGATVVWTGSIELQEIRRSVDFLAKLRRGDETYFRHVEFQSGNDPRMAERCFRYNSRLLLELGAPVLTTVLYVTPPAPPGRELVYQVLLGGTEVNSWRFGLVRLWEIPARAALADEAPGTLSLVPLLEGGDPPVIGAAAEKIRHAFPGEEMSDPEAILWLLARQRYNEEQLAPFTGRRNMQALIDLIKESPLWKEAWQQALQEGLQEGRQEGLHEGRLEAGRSVCLSLIRKHHPALLERAAPRIAACDDPAVLESWVLAASEHTDEPLARLLDDLPQG